MEGGRARCFPGLRSRRPPQGARVAFAAPILSGEGQEVRRLHLTRNKGQMEIKVSASPDSASLRGYCSKRGRDLGSPAGLRVKREKPLISHIGRTPISAARSAQSAFSLPRSFIQPEQFSCSVILPIPAQESRPAAASDPELFRLELRAGRPFSLTLSSSVDPLM